MRIVVFGASGGTGREVVAQAGAAGHEVTAVVRRAGSLGSTQDGAERMRVVVAGFDDSAALDDVVRGQEAVISALGTNEKGPVRVCTEGTEAIVAAMHGNGVGRLVAVSAFGAQETHDRSLYSRAVWASLPDKMRDKETMEAVIEASGLDWTIVRPPALSQGRGTGTYRTGTDLTVRLWSRISRADLASFLIAEVETPAFVGAFPRIAA